MLLHLHLLLLHGAGCGQLALGLVGGGPGEGSHRVDGGVGPALLLHGCGLGKHDLLLHQVTVGPIVVIAGLLLVELLWVRQLLLLLAD